MQKFILISFFSVSLMTVHAQNNAQRKAEKYLQGFEYTAAAKAFEEILELNPSNLRALEHLTTCYARLNDPGKAEKWLARLCQRTQASPDHYKQYAKVLASNGNYSESARWYKKYLEAVPDDHIKATVGIYQQMTSFYRDSSFYAIKPLASNTSRSDFSPAFYENGIVYCSSDDQSKTKRRYAWDNSAFIDLYRLNTPDASPEPFGKPINSPFHEGPATFSSGFDTVYFTRNNTNTHKPDDGIVRLKIFYSVKKNGAWQKEQSLPLNDDDYSTGHPSLAAGNRLYFVSDMPGGFGGTDIYYSEAVNGRWATPVNLGPGINTPGNEMFPFIDAGGNLYFASNTHPGLGGLDIFLSKKENGEFIAPANMGYPINSSHDDFGLIIKNNQGFFSSNRGQNFADDNIYSFTVNKTKTIFILPVSQTGKPLENFDLKITEGETVKLHHSGKFFTMDFDGEKMYQVGCSKAGYQARSLTIDRSFLSGLSGSDTVKMMLPEDKKDLTIELVSAEGKILGGGLIEVRNIDTGETTTYTANPNGAVAITVSMLSRYEITGSKTLYKTRSVTVVAADLISPDKSSIPIVLPAASVLFEKNEVGQLIELDIRYDVNKSAIRKDASRELDKLVIFLQKNMNVKVELGSHTDVRGSEEDNHKLSQSRAESAVRYIISKGISFERLIPVGYGETIPRVKDATSEEEHQQNRRTTVKIVGI